MHYADIFQRLHECILQSTSLRYKLERHDVAEDPHHFAHQNAACAPKTPKMHALRSAMSCPSSLIYNTMVLCPPETTPFPQKSNIYARALFRPVNQNDLSTPFSQPQIILHNIHPISPTILNKLKPHNPILPLLLTPPRQPLVSALVFLQLAVSEACPLLLFFFLVIAEGGGGVLLVLVLSMRGVYSLQHGYEDIDTEEARNGLVWFEGVAAHFDEVIDGGLRRARWR